MIDRPEWNQPWNYGEKWLGSGYILKGDPKGYANRLDVECVRERESERESALKADSEGLGPKKLEKWNCNILMWMGKMEEKKFEGYVRSSVWEYEV